MSNWLYRIVLVCISVVACGPAIAQDCDAILRGGAFNTSISDSTYDSRDTVMRFACNSSTVNSGGGVSALIDGVPVSGNAYQNKIRQSCGQYNRDRTVSRSDFNFVRDASAVIANAWTSCNSRLGTNISLQQSPDYRSFLVVLTYRRLGSAAPLEASATVNPVGGNVTCNCDQAAGTGTCAKSDTSFRVKIPDSGTQSLTCTRSSTTGVLFSLQSDVDGTRSASLPPMTLLPAAVVTPSDTFSSGGYCSFNNNRIGNLEVQVALYDYEQLPAMSLAYRGRYSNLGQVTVDPIVGFQRQNVRMEANRNTNASGLYLTIGDYTHRLLAQYGNYDCSGNVGRRQIQNLRVTTSIVNPFPAPAS